MILLFTWHYHSPSSQVGKGMSSDDFVQFMESLQTTKNLIMDPSRSVSTSTYAKITIRMYSEIAYMIIYNSRGHFHVVCILYPPTAPKEESPERQMEPDESEENPSDFFSRESQLIRTNSQGSNMLSSKRNSALRRSKRPADLASSTSQSNFNGREPVRSPEHVRAGG